MFLFSADKVVINLEKLNSVILSFKVLLAFSFMLFLFFNFHFQAIYFIVPFWNLYSNVLSQREEHKKQFRSSREFTNDWKSGWEKSFFLEFLLGPKM